MRFIKLLITLAVFGFAARAGGSVIFTGPVTDVDGRDSSHIQFPKLEAAVSFRPLSGSQKSLTVLNYCIHDLSNQKGLEIKATRRDNGLPAWAYQNITIKNLRLTNIERREDLPGGNGLHIDHIRIGGGGADGQDVKMNVVIENVEIDGGDALPILVTDGDYGTIVLRNVTIRNTTLNNAQFKTDKVGSIEKIIIDNSPGIGVALIGRPGSIGEVLVRNSPGIRLGDSLNATGRTGATISYIDPASGSSFGYGSMPGGLLISPAIPGGTPVGGTFSNGGTGASAVPEPAGLGVLGLAAPLLLRRRRAGS